MELDHLVRVRLGEALPELDGALLLDLVEGLAEHGLDLCLQVQHVFLVENLDQKQNRFFFLILHVSFSFELLS